jgi:lipoate-protein ligase A
MLAEWRLLDDGINEARHHFAIEEAIARLVDEDRNLPTLRLRQVNPAVFVGVHQNTWSEVNVDYCRAKNIAIVRRMNGGGAVYQEMGSFCFSAFFQRNLLPQSDQELYRLFAIPVIKTCADAGVTARYEGRNDVLVGNRKIFGSANFSWYHAYVQSGTFLVNMNFDVMAHALTPPALKFAGKSARTIQERVTSLSREAGRELDTREVIGQFTNHFAGVLGIQLVPGILSPAEQELAANLLAVKYSTDRWNFGSQSEFQLTVADRSDEGVISLSVDIEGEIIQKARITGDILRNHRQELDNLERFMTGCSIQAAKDAVGNMSFHTSIRESLQRLLEKVNLEVSGMASEKLRRKINE